MSDNPLKNVNLTQLNEMLSYAVDPQHSKDAIKVQWGSRDFYLVDPNAKNIKIHVKMHEIVSRFKELASKTQADEALVGNIHDRIFELDLLGDARLLKYGGSGWRDFKNIFTPNHSDENDKILSTLWNNKEISDKARGLENQNNDQKLDCKQLKDEILEEKKTPNSPKTTTNALRLLIQTKPAMAYSILTTLDSITEENEEFKAFVHTLLTESKIHIDPNGNYSHKSIARRIFLSDCITEIQKTFKKSPEKIIQKLKEPHIFNNYSAIMTLSLDSKLKIIFQFVKNSDNPKKFAEKFLNSDFRPNYQSVLRELADTQNKIVLPLLDALKTGLKVLSTSIVQKMEIYTDPDDIKEIESYLPNSPVSLALEEDTLTDEESDQYIILLDDSPETISKYCDTLLNQLSGAK